MKVRRKRVEFEPVTIELETPEELELFKRILVGAPRNVNKVEFADVILAYLP